MKRILILEDNPERLTAFREVVAHLGNGLEIKHWQSAHAMVAECADDLADALLISLDHDLVAELGVDRDPGTGYEVAAYLAGFMPVCPVVIHSSNTDRSWSMHNELRFAGWQVERISPIGENWIERDWLPRVRELLREPAPPRPFLKPSDHPERMSRSLLSLEGLAIGDAVGEMLANRYDRAPQWISERSWPSGPWLHTDDTEMAIAIVETLRTHGHVFQDGLARQFAWRFARDPDRGYGSGTRRQMREIGAGKSWRETAASAFDGRGSMGNGGAMRVAPLGAYYDGDLERLVAEAAASAVVTHTHSEGVAGTIAVAAAAALAWQLRVESGDERGLRLLNGVMDVVPESEVRRGLAKARLIPFEHPVASVARQLGNGSLVTAPDTVPFAIWCASRSLGDYSGALADAISVGGDCDTNGAIVGGIVALSVGGDGIPSVWREARERFSFDTQEPRSSDRTGT